MMQRLVESPRDDAGRPSNASAERVAPPMRIAYAPPSLAVYGQVDELTQTVGRKGRKDSRRGSRRTGF